MIVRLFLSKTFRKVSRVEVLVSGYHSLYRVVLLSLNGGYESILLGTAPLKCYIPFVLRELAHAFHR